MDKVLNYENLINNLIIFDKLYDIIRVVDPLRKITYLVKDNGLKEESITCYQFWKKDKMCSNCISMRSYNNNDTYVKIEFNGNKLFMITSIPIITDKGKLIVEFLKDITNNVGAKKWK